MDLVQECHSTSIINCDFKRGVLVLVHNTAIKKELNQKMKAWYYGPMVVSSRNHGGAYILCELDGMLFHRPFAAFHLVPFYARRKIPLPSLEDVLDVPRVSPLMEKEDDEGVLDGEKEWMKRLQGKEPLPPN